MTVRRLQLHNFRNYNTATIEFGNHVNLLIGDNAQGKTSALEAIYLCSIGRSARTPRDKELIKIGCQSACVSTIVHTTVATHRIDIVIDSQVNKRVGIDNMPISRLGELMGVCSCVMFSPDELSLVKDGPSARRKLIDIALCQLSRTYFYMLASYNKVLAQRNRLLKSGANFDTLAVWDVQLADIGARLTKSRRGYVQRLQQYCAARHSTMTQGAEQLAIHYDGIEGDSVDAIRLEYERKLQESRARDIRFGVTHIGPHKDDMSIAIDGRPARIYGSQGQQRTAALSLKMAEIDIIQAHTGQSPVLLLDDVLSELDHHRCNQLLEMCKNVQTIITATHVDAGLLDVVGGARVYQVQGGVVERAQLAQLSTC